MCVSVLNVWACQSVGVLGITKNNLFTWIPSTFTKYMQHNSSFPPISERTVILVYLNLSTIFSVALKCNKHRALRPTPWDNPIWSG